MKIHEAQAFCPYYHRAVELIGRRWTGAILRAMLLGVSRFSDLTETIPGLSDRMLSERLKELESEGLVLRLVIPETPVRIEYHLTEKGRDLSSVIEAVSGWAEEWLAETRSGTRAAEARPPAPLDASQ
jgi:DNA-binding HxlR family transcriptional regulator